MHFSNPRRFRALQRTVEALFERLECRTLMSTYYVSPGGDNAAAGTSAGAAWQTISKVNATVFKPGDSILFQGGQTFTGGLSFDASDGGSATNAVVVASYGSGRATIRSGTATGAWLINTGGIWFENLIFSGTPNGGEQNGIRFEARAAGYRGFNVRVDHCDISGYGFAGVEVLGDRADGGYSDVRITHNNIHDNVDDGIASCAVTERTHHNIYVADNVVYNNYGDGSSIVTGNGIMIGDADGALIERNISHDNGAAGGNGGCGIWAYESNNVRIQYNESYHNRTLRGRDGDGFDLDTDTSNSVIQYNFSHDNDGNGYQLDQWRDNALFSNNVIRYNISQNDGRRNSYAGLEVWGRITNSAIYNNVVYLTDSSTGNPSGIKVHNSSIADLFAENVTIANNVIFARGGSALLTVTVRELAGATKLAFVNNDWWTGGDAIAFNYGATTYTTLAAWEQGSGQEKANNLGVGLFADPGLKGAGMAATLDDPANLRALSEYQLLPTSPLFNRGENLPILSGVDQAKTDFFGNALPVENAYEVGIEEVAKPKMPPVVGGPGGGTTGGSTGGGKAGGSAGGSSGGSGGGSSGGGTTGGTVGGTTGGTAGGSTGSGKTGDGTSGGGSSTTSGNGSTPGGGNGATTGGSTGSTGSAGNGSTTGGSSGDPPPVGGGTGDSSTGGNIDGPPTDAGGGSGSGSDGTPTPVPVDPTPVVATPPAPIAVVTPPAQPSTEPAPAAARLGVAPALSGTLPSEIVAGMKNRMRQALALSNSAATVQKGKFSIAFYLSTAPFIDPATTPFKSFSRHLRFKIGAMRTIATSLRIPASAAAGDYFLMVRVTSPDGNLHDAAASVPLHISAPSVQVLAALEPGAHRGVALLRLANAGNTAMSGRITVTLEASTDETAPDAVVTRRMIHVHVGAGAVRIIRIRFRSRVGSRFLGAHLTMRNVGMAAGGNVEEIGNPAGIAI